MIAIVAIAVSGCGTSGDDARGAAGGGGVSFQHVSGSPFGVALAIWLGYGSPADAPGQPELARLAR
jgi:hypothetical protein